MSGAVEGLSCSPRGSPGVQKASDGSRDPTVRQQKAPPLMLCIGKDFLCLNWKRLPYSSACHKTQIYGLGNEREKNESPDYARAWRGPRQSREQRGWGNVCAGLWPVPRSSSSTPPPFLQEPGNSASPEQQSADKSPS